MQTYSSQVRGRFAKAIDRRNTVRRFESCRLRFCHSTRSVEWHLRVILHPNGEVKRTLTKIYVIKTDVS